MFLRFSIDKLGNPLVVGDYTYPGEEEGRFLLLSWWVGWGPTRRRGPGLS